MEKDNIVEEIALVLKRWLKQRGLVNGLATMIDDSSRTSMLDSARSWYVIEFFDKSKFLTSTLTSHGMKLALKLNRGLVAPIVFPHPIPEYLHAVLVEALLDPSRVKVVGRLPMLNNECFESIDIEQWEKMAIETDLETCEEEHVQ